VPSYLEMSLKGFSDQRERMQKEFSGAFGGAEMMERVQEQVMQNLQLFDRAMKMFSPFGYARPPEEGSAAPPSAAAPAAAAPAAPASDEAIAQLKAQMEAMQKQIESLAKKG